MKPQSRPSPRAVTPSEPHDEVEVAASHYISFILRCRITADGSVLARLSEVRSGLSSAVTDLDELPDLVRRFIADQGATR
jgi:hypothetical protein